MDYPPTPPDDALFGLLGEHQPDAVGRVWECLAPYYQIAKRRTFPLAPAEELNAEEIAEVIQRALDLEMLPEIIFVSASSPFPQPQFPQPQWMTNDVYQKVTENSYNHIFLDYLGECIGVDLGNRLGHILKESFEDPEDFPNVGFLEYVRARLNEKGLGSSLKGNHMRFESILGKLFYHLKDKLRRSIFNEGIIGYHCWNSVYKGFLLYVGLVLMGHVEKAERVANLLKLQQKCILPGSQRENPFTWFVLCK